MDFASSTQGGGTILTAKAGPPKQIAEEPVVFLL
jgi:hypothetical protein